MDISENKSEVARLRQRIEEEYEAAWQGLYGLREGTAKHEFITARMEQMGSYHNDLAGLVGAEEAASILCEIANKPRPDEVPTGEPVLSGPYAQEQKR